MRPVEVADAEMNHTAGQLLAAVKGNADARAEARQVAAFSGNRFVT